MAWAEKLPSGKYRGLYRDAHGKRRSAGTFTHKPKAERAAAAKEEAARRTMRRDPEAYKRPWGEWADEWWVSRTVEDSTSKADSSRRRTHLDKRWKDVAIGSITRQDVRAWAAEMKRQEVGPATIQKCVLLLSVSLAAAVDAEIIDANPAARIKGLPKGAQAAERFLTRKEYALLRAHLPTTLDQLIADVLVHTGLRWGEMAGLHWDRVDLARGILRVVETFSDSKGVIKSYPKGKRIRDVPLTPELVEALEKRKADAAGGDCGVQHATGRCRGGLVLTTEGGSVLRNSNWSPGWREAVELSHVGHVRIHDLRHTYASWLLQAGVPLAEVGRLLGHVSTQTTQKYAHLAETPSAQILSALAAPRKPHEDEPEG